MGKKTNWTTAEDHALCRVWLSASDLQLQSGDQKASNFWNVVRELFHQEVETAVERPLNGLKVRWTRINRDSQKFAGIFNEIQHKGMKQTEVGSEDSSDAAAVALLTEQQWIDEAKDIFHRIYSAKFSFESCWKQLRYSNSAGYERPEEITTSDNAASTPAAAISSRSHENMSRVPTTTSNEQEEIITSDNAVTTSSPSPPSRSHGTTCTSSVGAVAAVAAASLASTDANTYTISSNKRQADAQMESFTHVESQTQFQSLTAALIEELKRQNDLMEDQNAIALLKVNDEMISDPEARHCYQLLQDRYLKKARTNGYSTNGRTSTSV
ncbi:Glutathione S-transferase T3-like [Phytophthora palmivora]|uniref:Glutathione S-transferase T3-like n=1 Tax=Phytophthora palmivora TaxID=4796 RepID=A0A2P4X8G4_9STRA|nr:Glutathione S-transferase T3-like [Phytophthora palmivora]